MNFYGMCVKCFDKVIIFSLSYMLVQRDRSLQLLGNYAYASFSNVTIIYIYIYIYIYIRRVIQYSSKYGLGW
jgi:hypothetical protein